MNSTLMTKYIDTLPGLVRFSPEEIWSYLADGAWLDDTAGDLLRRIARRYPDRAALVADGQRISYGEYDRRSERLAAALLKLGLRPGDRALFQMASVPETAIALFACFKAGVIPVCTLPQHRAVDIEAISAIAEPRAHFVQADASRFDLVQFALEMRERIPSLEHVLVSRGGPVPGAFDMEALIAGESDGAAEQVRKAVCVDYTDVLVFQLSGGTTGLPKVMPRFHGEFLAYSQAWADRVDLGPDDVHLWALPLIHNASQIYHLFPALLGARKLCLMARFDAESFFRIGVEEGVTVTGSIGPIASAILEFDRLADFDISHFKAFTTLNRADVIEAHIRRPVVSVFGISEGLLMGSGPDDPAEARHHTVGRPVSDRDEIRLLAADGETEVAFGQVGELAFRGPSSIRGYYNAPERNATAFTRDGFFRSGDLMRAHAIEGRTYYSFEGRLKDNIDRGGEKFGTEDIEELASRHEAVADAIVVAMPDAVYGEVPCAFITLRPGRASPGVGQLSEFLLAHGLARYKLPVRIEVVEGFPVTRVGKIDRVKLRSAIAEKIAAGA